MFSVADPLPLVAGETVTQFGAPETVQAHPPGELTETETVPPDAGVVNESGVTAKLQTVAAPVQRSRSARRPRSRLNARGRCLATRSPRFAPDRFSYRWGPEATRLRIAKSMCNQPWSSLRPAAPIPLMQCQ